MDRPRLLIIGGGVLGTMHAVSGVDRGFDVVQIEREADARGASLRNFGLVWVSGRASGPELDLALKARERWEAIGARCPGTGFRANGSITVARSEEELALMGEAARAPDAARRGFSILSPAEVIERNPVLRGRTLGALWCSKDAGVEPRLVPRAVRTMLEATGRYQFIAGREVREVGTGRAVDHLGDVYAADLIVLCTGAAHSGLAGEVLGRAPLRRVRLQMFETEPLGEVMTTSLADGDSLRYYPAFDLPGRENLAPQAPIPAAHRVQLLCQQRLDGSLTVGDTHYYEQPFDFDLDEDPTTHLVDTLAAVLGRPVPRIVRRWAGVY
ncbi:MAG: FAD-dependent oxidoreductase, partial [Actinomycetes bacterium]